MCVVTFTTEAQSHYHVLEVLNYLFTDKHRGCEFGPNRSESKYYHFLTYGNGTQRGDDVMCAVVVNSSDSLRSKRALRPFLTQCHKRHGQAS